MKIEHAAYLIAVCVAIHYLLAQPNLQPALRSLLGRARTPLTPCP